MKVDSAELAVLAVRTSQYPNDNKCEFLLLGRSNVGKSSFINTLINRKGYAKVSAKPGKTQTLNFYIINNLFYLVDAPGYGFANVNKLQQKKFGMMIEEYLKTRTNLKSVFLLVDFRHKPTEDDRLMYEFLKYYNLHVNIVATKMDKVSKNDYEKQKKIIKETLNLSEDDSLILFSSLTKKGRDDIYGVLEKYIENGDVK